MTAKVHQEIVSQKFAVVSLNPQRLASARMNRGQPPWHASRQQLERSLQTLQSANHEPGHQKENDLPQQRDNAVQLLHSRIAAVKRALLASPAKPLANHDEASQNTDGSAATHHIDDKDLLYLDDDIAGETAEKEVLRVFGDAVAAHDALDFAAALPLFKLAGSSGHGRSCGYVALYCIEGRATVRDKDEASRWMRVLARMSNG
jgi:hypothetical protein